MKYLKMKKILGICLGMQLLGNSSEEGLEKGLGWINAYSKKFDAKEKFISLPIMGWNKISIKKGNNLLNDLNDCRFYFLHSYHVHCQNDDDIIATTDYVKEYNCCISNKNIYGVQFHPEKSHKYGMKLLKILVKFNDTKKNNTMFALS